MCIRDRVNIGIGAVSPSRSVGNAGSLMTPNRRGISRLAIGQDGGVAGREIVAIVLIELVSARTFREEEKGACFGVEAGVVDPVVEKSHLGAGAARLGDEMHLVGVAKAG